MVITTQARIERMKVLLNSLEQELGFFRDGSKADRVEYGKAFANGNTGYISSLMVMLASEEKFRSWATFTTWKFRKFK